MNPNGPVENYIVLYNFSDITFKVRVVIQELGIDITAMVTPEGNVGYPQETWIDIGSIPALNDETGANPQMQVKLWAEAKGIKFHLSDTWFSRRR